MIMEEKLTIIVYALPVMVVAALVRHIMISIKLKGLVKELLISRPLHRIMMNDQRSKIILAALCIVWVGISTFNYYYNQKWFHEYMNEKGEHNKDLKEWSDEQERTIIFCKKANRMLDSLNNLK